MQLHFKSSVYKNISMRYLYNKLKKLTYLYVVCKNDVFLRQN